MQLMRGHGVVAPQVYRAGRLAAMLHVSLSARCSHRRKGLPPSLPCAPPSRCLQSGMGGRSQGEGREGKEGGKGGREGETAEPAGSADHLPTRRSPCRRSYCSAQQAKAQRHVRVEASSWARQSGHRALLNVTRMTAGMPPCTA